MIDKLSQILNSFKCAEMSTNAANSLDECNERLKKIDTLKEDAKKDFNLALYKNLEQEENELLNKRALFEQVDKS